jgi:hypothetical protein
MSSAQHDLAAIRGIMAAIVRPRTRSPVVSGATFVAPIVERIEAEAAPPVELSLIRKQQKSGASNGR